MPWKDTQSKNQVRKRNRLALIVLSCVIGLLLFSWAIQFTRGLFSSSSSRSYLWDGEFNINLAVRSSGIAVLSYNPKEKKITVLTVPDETFLEVPRGYGRWQIRAVYGLGGNRLLKETLTSFLAVPVDGFLDLTDAPANFPDAAFLVSKLRENPFSGFSLLSFLKTDLTLWELLKLKMAVQGVRFDKITHLDLAERDVLDKGLLPDGSRVYTADPVRIDSILEDFADPAFLAEHRSIAVFNAADKPLLAQKWARLIVNLGGNVVITANAGENLPKTAVYGEESKTLKRLRQIFELDCQNNPKCVKISPKDVDLASSRAQINIFLGEDYQDK